MTGKLRANFPVKNFPVKNRIAGGRQMPITCTIAFPRLSEAEMRDIDYHSESSLVPVHSVPSICRKIFLSSIFLSIYSELLH